MKSLRIVIDGRMFGESGIGRYIRNLISELQILDKKNEYFILLLKDNYDTLAYHNNFHKVLADFRWYGVEEQIKLLGLLKSLEPSLVHFPHFNVPVFFRGKFVVTIHDLIHQHFSMKRVTAHGPIVYKLKQAGYKIIFKNALAKSLKILVPSYFVKDQLVKDWQVNAEKIVVTSEAIDDKIIQKTQMSKLKCQNLLKKLNIRQPYIFYVGNAHPHKNVEGLIRVFGELREKNQGLSLVLSGSDHYFWQRLKKENQSESIIYTGFVTDEELVALYKGAKVFVMPSFEEGFGIPILEAMACFCPVISSNVGSLREVGGDAAIYFGPFDREDMASKVSMVLKSDKIQQDLITKGRVRVKAFSWQKLAKETLEVYQKCVLQ